MRSKGFLKKLASGVLAVGFLAGIGMASGSTASAADRNHDDHNQYRSYDIRDGRDHGRDRYDQFRGGDWDDHGRIFTDRDDWYWVRDRNGRWIHERRSIDWGDGRAHR